MPDTEPSVYKLFWVWRNSWFAERKQKAQWAYDLVKNENHTKEFTLELLEDLVTQSERSMTFEGMLIAQAHRDSETHKALQDYGSPHAFMLHLERCEACRKLWTLRYDHLKDKHADKQPY